MLPPFDPIVPAARIRLLNTAPLRPAAEHVLYWMTSARRLGWNFGLQRAVAYAVELRKPLVVLEALRCDYPHASDRLHRFVLDGMSANRRAAAKTAALYYPYVEPSAGHGRGLLTALAATACAVVTDWYPSFFLPRMVAAAAQKLDVVLEAVDSNGLIPLADQKQAFASARSYRAFVQRALLEHVTKPPEEAPLQRLDGSARPASLNPSIAGRWPAASDRLLDPHSSELARYPIDHSVAPSGMRGGHQEAGRRLRVFLDQNLRRYAEEGNDPDAEASSRLSPYLHFGHIAASEIFSTLMTHEGWTSRRLGKPRGGAREGWWGVSAGAEAFLDQLVVWRELAFNGCEYVGHYAKYGSLPEWSRATLEAHRADPRPKRYTVDRLEAAQTDDPIWNAAQRQLLHEGWFHNYLRMLWGKKILEWSSTAEEALERMTMLMDRHSLDGRDPNSYAGYTWVLGRYDRPWPERPIYGTVRAMSSESTRRKLKMKRFLDRYGEMSGPTQPSLLG